MVRTAWRNARKNMKISLKELGPRRSLENRIVLCVDCDSNRTLAISSSGNPICSSCGSENWMFTSTSIIAHFKNFETRETPDPVPVLRLVPFWNENKSFRSSVKAGVSFAEQFE